jgi:2-dehydro-3-deoxygluconokinase
MPSLITFGETSAVFVARDIGRMRYCRDFGIRPGGAEATVAVGARKLGIDAAWISALGDDEMGHYILGMVAAEQVDVSRVAMVPGKPTAIFLRERLPGGAARHSYYRAGSAFSAYRPEMLDAAFLGSARILHLTGITPALSDSCEASMWRAIEIARAGGAQVTFDPNVRLSLWNRDRARPVLERFMAAADIVLPGIEDLEMLYGAITPPEALARLRALGCRRIVLKPGTGDVLVADGAQETVVPVQTIADPVDLMGAGDAFAAGCLAGLLKGRDLAAASELGVAVASLAIQLPGNIEAMPSWEEVERLRTGATVWNR